MAGNEVAARRTCVAVAMGVEVDDGLPRPVLARDKALVFLRLLLVQAERGLHIEAGAGEEIAGEEVAGHVADHHFLHEPGAALRE